MEPIEYFGGHERVVNSLEDLFARAQQVDALSDRTGLRFYWRGQADASWGCHSSLHRWVARLEGVEVEDLQDSAIVAVENQMVSESREWIRPGVGARLPTTDLMARLQHFGVPTRLLDFTRDYKVAAYFAAMDAPDRDGRLIVAAARGTPSEDFRNAFTVPWEAASLTRPADWSTQLYVLDDHADFPRIIRQRGVFLFGGTPSTRPQRRTASGYSLLAAEVRQCMSVPLALHGWAQAEAAETGGAVPGRIPTVASALTIRIPQTAKAGMMRDLEIEEYSRRMLFPDPEGYRDHGDLPRRLFGG